MTPVSSISTNTFCDVIVLDISEYRLQMNKDGIVLIVLNPRMANGLSVGFKQVGSAKSTSTSFGANSDRSHRLTNEVIISVQGNWRGSARSKWVFDHSELIP